MQCAAWGDLLRVLAGRGRIIGPVFCAVCGLEMILRPDGDELIVNTTPARLRALLASYGRHEPEARVNVSAASSPRVQSFRRGCMDSVDFCIE